MVDARNGGRRDLVVSGAAMLALAAIVGAAGAWLLYGGLGSGVGALFERRMGRPTSEARVLRMLAGGGVRRRSSRRLGWRWWVGTRW